MSAQRDTDRNEGTKADQGREGRGDDLSGWLAESALRMGLALVGLVLLVYALGRAVGVDLLAIVVDALLSPIGRWLLVAFFALLLIVVAQRGFRTRA